MISDCDSVAELFMARCQQTPTATFISFADQHWTYQQSLQCAASFAHLLHHELDLPAENRVAVYLSKRPETLWAFFGTQLSGMTYVSLSFNQPAALLQITLSRTQADILITEESARQSLQALDLSAFKKVIYVESIDWQNLATRSVTHKPPAKLASIMFTSGTTGRSKAVRLPQPAFYQCATALATALELKPSDVILDWAPQWHVGNLIDEVMSTVVAGARLAMVKTFSTSKFWSQMKQHGVTVFGGFSNVFQYLLNQAPCAEEQEHCARVAIGAGVPMALANAFEQRFKVPLVDYYGMTEAPIITVPILNQNQNQERSCGVVSREFDIAIIDDAGFSLAPGTQGRVVVRPRYPGVFMQGYDDDPAATVTACRDLWFHTQDRGYLDTHNRLYLTGRLQNSIRRGGENISCEELEALIHTHQGIADCAAVGIATAIGDEAVRLVVELHPEQLLTLDALMEFCHTSLPKYMWPNEIIILDKLPYTDVGKLNRQALRELKL
jgi:carnitine-CoA ligase